MTVKKTSDFEADVILFSDGGCSGNPGPGGWAYILRHPRSGKEMEKSGCVRETTNNRMEMTAVIEGLRALKKAAKVEIVTDSQYVGHGLTEWMPKWKSRGWKLPGNKPVKNLDLWQELDRLVSLHQVRFMHVRGHTGHPENERCDELATAAYQKYLA
ncbi:MAG: ribonuclease HI [Candidatus Omnitrophica bacterium]|nr:ribonuclease HI [Candidatus Omnitrophota bacterium]